MAKSGKTAVRSKRNRDVQDTRASAKRTATRKAEPVGPPGGNRHSGAAARKQAAAKGWRAPSCDLDLGVIGNGTVNALIDARGRICWHCVPAFD
ncbi:MAG: hypothetical protein JSS21_00670, partial [Proteobacteria bacterium]|nr:hypothetical protein [Pseudomonadota bacterium]